jgi:hypothetical protein
MVNGSCAGGRVGVEAGVFVAGRGLGIKVGETVKFGDCGICVWVGREMLVGEGGGMRRGTDKLLQEAINIRMNISIKKRRMHIL